MAESKKMSVALWVFQIVLALLFLFTGGFKLFGPAAVLMKQSPLPLAFLRVLGAVEILGALGLILPGLTRIQTGLTPLAASGLVIIMIGAVVVTIRTMGIGPAIFPFVVGIIAAWVAWGRWRIAPLPSRARQVATVS